VVEAGDSASYDQGRGRSDRVGDPIERGRFAGPTLSRVFPDRLRLPLRFDPARLERDLARLRAAAWTRHFVTRNYAGDWSAIPLRGPAGETHPIRMIYADPTASAFEDGPALSATPYFRAVLAAFACPLQSVRLMRLTPGSRIQTHSDYDLDFESGTIRIHVPVVTNPGVEFRLNGAPVPLAAGSAWYLRLSDPHSVDNRGDADRVHLVIDAVADDWARDLLSRGTPD
jgi:Aspartyl/Asparaginyl beta-hydroxylase